jgi:predicted amidohydrolase
MLADRALLALAAKKAYKFVGRRQWYHDRSDPATFMARLNFQVRLLSDEILAGTYTPSPRIMFPAPKRIEKETGEEERYIYRPLSTQAFRDEVVEVALLCLFADQFESAWGDSQTESFPKVVSFGNRLHRVGADGKKTFSIGGGGIYRDWADDYSKFVRETERAFNSTLKNLRDDERVVLICSDVKSFYPTIDRAKVANIVKNASEKDLHTIIDTIFGAYHVKASEGQTEQGRLLEAIGLAQGPAHSGFWANVYLQDFDHWIVHTLPAKIQTDGTKCALAFYARYVDDTRIIFRAPKTSAEVLTKIVKASAAEYLSRINLSLSEEKTLEIVQDATGSLLSTGQVAERMQSITKRAYFPLPPENLDDLAREVRLLFHAETTPLIRAATGPQTHVILDNPGVRVDSRRRFAATKWVRITRDLENITGKDSPERKIFAEELVRVWHEDPGQTQLLQRALEIGLETASITVIVKRLYSLKEIPAAAGYYAFVLAYLLDTACTSRIDFRAWPLRTLAKEVLRRRWNHTVLLNKAQQFLLRDGAKTTNAEDEQVREAGALFFSLRKKFEGSINSVTKLQAAEEIAVIVGLPVSDRKLTTILLKIAETRNERGKERLIRALLTRKPEVAAAVAEKLSIKVFELRAFQTEQPRSASSKSLYRAILAGKYKAPVAWTRIALKLAKFARTLDNSVFWRGQFNPFALRMTGSDEFELRPNRPMTTFQSAGSGESDFFETKLREWSLPIGLTLRAAATGRARDLLGATQQARLGLAGAFSTIVRSGGRLPLDAGTIIDRLCAWPGSKIKGYKNITEFSRELRILQKHLVERSAENATICDVKLSAPSIRAKSNSDFNVVLCQVPSYPVLVDDATIRRALSIARLILEQKSSEKRSVDLVIFPELSVPQKSLGTLCRFARQTRTLVLAGLAPRPSQDGQRSLNELVWIIPLDDEYQRLAVLPQEKIHVTPAEGKIRPPIVKAAPPVIWRIFGPKGRLAAINCYEFTDLLIRNLLRGRIEALVIAANNQDVTTFDNLVESTHYDLFAHVILVNAERFGGSAIRAPYKDSWDRRVFDIHGNNLFAVNLASLDLADFRRAGLKKTKALPAGFTLHP